MNKKKTLRNDLILIGSLLLVVAVTLTLIFTLRKKQNLIAKIYVQNQVVETIDLSKREDKEYIIHGLYGELHVHTHDGAIAVTKSNCPHQDCVYMGYVSTTNRPIICAYNAVCITIDGQTINDVEI